MEMLNHMCVNVCILALQYIQPYDVIDVVNELYKHTNYLLLDCSFTESCAVSNLLNSFGMYLFRCQTWRFNKKTHLKDIHVAWRK